MSEEIQTAPSSEQAAQRPGPPMSTTLTMLSLSAEPAIAPTALHQATTSHCGSKFAMKKSNPVRGIWALLIALLLVYTGTVFLYRLCFIDFRITMPDEAVAADGNSTHMAEPAPEQRSSLALNWEAFDMIVTIIFWIDLFANFAFTYDDAEGNEVDDLWHIARHYVETYFGINLIACIPEDLVELLIAGAMSDYPDTLNQGVRALRLQRISRLARLMRLTRLAKINAHKHSHLWHWFEKQKGIRVVNLACGLAWCVHILACGWYLCAALHEVPDDTWVMRRTVDFDGEKPLVECDAFDQWMHSIYFVFTVFTTVGFGDMSAVTTGEIVYVCITMAIGAVVHSIIISEVINVVTSNDLTNVFVTKQRDLVEAFSEHTMLDEKAATKLVTWVDQSARFWVTHRYDRDEMRELITGKYMPRSLLGSLPSALFEGRLIRNRYLKVCDGMCCLPPRLPLLLALAVHKSTFNAGDIIYQAQDYPFNLFLVLSGTFAYVAKPTPEGGIHYVAPLKKRTQRYADIKEDKSKKMFTYFNHRTVSAGMGSEDSLVDPEPPLFPYMLFSAYSYFGDLELCKNGPRKATARCESDEGDVLTVHKKDFRNLADEFPQFGARWAQESAVREVTRYRQQARLLRGRTYRNFAASTIQDFYRTYRQRKASGQDDATGEGQEVARRSKYSVLATQKKVNVQLLYDKHDTMHDEIFRLSKEVSSMHRKLDTLLSSGKLAL